MEGFEKSGHLAPNAELLFVRRTRDLRRVLLDHERRMFPAETKGVFRAKVSVPERATFRTYSMSELGS